MGTAVDDGLAGTAVIVGSGLIGASLGLALTSRGWQVHLRDVDDMALARAVSLGAGDLAPPSDAMAVSLVLICAPPSAVGDLAVTALQEFPRAIVTDVASVKASIVRSVQEANGADRFVPGHPMAGREMSGPTGARSDLFEGRPWVVIDAPGAPEALQQVRTLIVSLGAIPVAMTASQHDSAVAVVSHTPQLIASALAAQLGDVDTQVLALAGQGVRDTTRIAASDPQLWGQIIKANAPAVREVLDGVIDDLRIVRSALDGQDAAETADAVEALVQRGRDGQASIPGKHGGRAARYATVSVIIPDRAGSLAALFNAVGELQVNIEDLTLEHSPGQPVGLATLFVAPHDADVLAEGLNRAEWIVHQ
jgi:prephenate dehydrogenase